MQYQQFRDKSQTHYITSMLTVTDTQLSAICHGPQNSAILCRIYSMKKIKAACLDLNDHLKANTSLLFSQILLNVAVFTSICYEMDFKIFVLLSSMAYAVSIHFQSWKTSKSRTKKPCSIPSRIWVFLHLYTSVLLVLAEILRWAGHTCSLWLCVPLQRAALVLALLGSKWKPNSQSPSTGLFCTMCGKLLQKDGFAWGSHGACALEEAEVRPGLQEIEQE